MDYNLKREKELQIPKIFSVSEVDDFRKSVYACIESGEVHFILDFSGCEFIDSTGLGVIVGVYKKCLEQGGSLKLRAIRPQIMKLFQLTRLDRVFDIV